MATFSSRITDLIGPRWGDLSGTIETFNNSVSEIVDVVPKRFLIKYADNPLDLNTSSPTSAVIEGKKIYDR